MRGPGRTKDTISFGYVKRSLAGHAPYLLLGRQRCTERAQLCLVRVRQRRCGQRVRRTQPFAQVLRRGAVRDPCVVQPRQRLRRRLAPSRAPTHRVCQHIPTHRALSARCAVAHLARPVQPLVRELEQDHLCALHSLQQRALSPPSRPASLGEPRAPSSPRRLRLAAPRTCASSMGSSLIVGRLERPRAKRAPLHRWRGECGSATGGRPARGRGGRSPPTTPSRW